MKVSERLSVIEKIAAEMQARYTYADINAYFRAMSVGTPNSWGDFNSKRVYAKAILSGLPLDVIGRIADDLDLGALAHVSAQANPPAVWHPSRDFRLFLSHLSKDKDKATRLRDCLKPYAITAFVAHEDIHPTLEWQAEIERGLLAMDALVAIHTPGFSASFWTQQEIGYALGRGIKVISFRMGEDPKGFISKHQALSRHRKSAEQIAEDIRDLLANDARTGARLAEAQGAREDSIPF
jgi:hypothetical protein